MFYAHGDYSSLSHSGQLDVSLVNGAEMTQD